MIGYPLVEVRRYEVIGYSLVEVRRYEVIGYSLVEVRRYEVIRCAERLQHLASQSL